MIADVVDVPLIGTAVSAGEPLIVVRAGDVASKPSRMVKTSTDNSVIAEITRTKRKYPTSVVSVCAQVYELAYTPVSGFVDSASVVPMRTNTLGCPPPPLRHMLIGVTAVRPPRTPLSAAPADAVETKRRVAVPPRAEVRTLRGSFGATASAPETDVSR